MQEYQDRQVEIKQNKMREKLKNELYLKGELRQQVHHNVHEHEKRLARYAKENAVQKATEVIALIEKMAENNPNIEGRLIKNTVIDNLVAKDAQIKDKYHAGKVQDKEYWSLKLLRRLGVIPSSKPKQLTPI